VSAIIGAGPVAPAYAKVTAVTAQNQPGLKEGTGYAGLSIGTFTGTDVASSYSATVTLGDHPPIQGVVYEYPVASGHFFVSTPSSTETQPFADEGTVSVSFVVSDATDQSANPSTTAIASVGESDSLTLNAGVLVAATAGKPFSGTVFTFTNTYSQQVGAETPATDFFATIHWGDGTPDSAGVVSGSGTSFAVTGSHTYLAAGNFAISFGVGDDKPGGTAGFGSPGSAHVVDPSATSVSSSANPSVSGHPLIFDAFVTLTSGSAVPTGSVAFSDGSIPLATVALSGGTGRFSTSALTAGDHTITASYSGDSNYAPSSGSTVETVTGSPTGAPSAVFNAPTAAVAGSPTGFDGSQSSDPGGTIGAYSWDFGDGSMAGTGVTPQHTYANAGTYAVKLTVTNTAGKTGTATHLVTVAARGTRTTPPPRISGAKISPGAFVAERGSGSSATARSKRGARVRFRLSEAATVTFTIQRKASGRKTNATASSRRARTARGRGARV
jgi:PKD repeat protein